MSCYLYKFCCVHKLPAMERRQVGVDLERLHPGMSGRELQMDYYVEKLRLMILVLLIGSGLTGALTWRVMLDSGMGQKAVLERGAVGEGEWEAHLVAEIGGEKEEVYINVLERQLMEEEVQMLFDACISELEGQIAAHCNELGQVTKSLELPESVDGYPFEITWKSSNPMLIGMDGALKQEQYEGGEQVYLTATLWYGDQSMEQEFLVEPATLVQETPLRRSLQEAIWQQDNESRYEEELPLPECLGEEKISWTLVTENDSLVFLVLTLVAAVGVFMLKDKDLHEQMLERKRSLKMAYPTILNKFVLYMGAGMTVRGSFFKIATDYRKNGEEEQVIYEEMLYSCGELSAGVSEGLVYERFGKRSGLQEYARFSTMLVQNLKKGNSTLLGRLREESEKAMQEDLQFRKKIGEEAETKLLVPMIMMLGIVMLLVMIPAFAAFE
ncbi:MAG: hypothetical protein IJX63_10045 [Lachnospiraceae bacterium]|nr:hypothetical protein [Lachnospiraceae bacterium]